MVFLNQYAKSTEYNRDMDFTQQQQQVIDHDPTKNGVVRAGPGTGKSLTVVALAQRVTRTDPNIKVRFVTFTRAATSELIKKIMENGGETLRPSTIHSFAMSILMQNQDALPISLPLRIPSEYEAKKIIYPYIGRLIGERSTRVEKLVRAMASMWESLDEDFEIDDITPEQKARFIGAFQHATRLFGFTLLDQLPDLLRRLLLSHPYASGLDFQFMIVDEFQDLNKCEIELLKHLTTRGISVLAVGDEDQSIYSFRKAHPIGIREFETHFPNAIGYELSICHRCPNNLLGWAQHVILGDLARPPRTFPESRSTSDAEIKLLHFVSDSSEATGVAFLISKLIARGLKPHEILVLTRFDDKERFTKKIKEHLQEKEISVFDSKETKKLLENKDVKLLFAYMRLMGNEKDSLAWHTLLAESGGIGATTIQSIVTRADIDSSSFGEAVLAEEVGALGSKPAFNNIRERLNAIQQIYEEKNSDEEVAWGHWMLEAAIPQMGFTPSSQLNEFLLAADERVEIEKPSLGYLVSQLVPIAKDIANEQQSGILFMSMQGSKGLTARATIVVGVDNDLIPSPRNRDQNEERRLLYVAMTRSQEFLVMTWANRRQGPQARSGTPNAQRRTHCAFLEGGPITSEDGNTYVSSLPTGI